MQLVGGQAVFEGVMMRNKDRLALALRNEDGTITLKKYRLRLLRHTVSRVPFLRGLVNLLEMLIIGTKAMNLSTQQQVRRAGGSPVGTLTFAALFLFALAFALVLFKFVPLLLAQGLYALYPSGLLFNLSDGVFRLLLFLGYVLLIGQLADVRRVFEYHGAEHKTVSCYEARKALTPEEAQTFSTFHPRCGTSFIILVLLLSLLLFAAIPADLPFLAKYVYRLSLLPLLAGLSYELLRFTARHARHPLVRPFLLPGYLTQRLTTRQPDKNQLEVALAALKAVI